MPDETQEEWTVGAVDVPDWLLDFEPKFYWDPVGYVEVTIHDPRDTTRAIGFATSGDVIVKIDADSIDIQKQGGVDQIRLNPMRGMREALWPYHA